MNILLQRWIIVIVCFWGGGMSTGAQEEGSWSALGNGIDGWVGAITVDAFGNLYTGGGFTQAGGVAANEVARWNGTSWSALGQGLSYGYGVQVLTTDDTGNLYAGSWSNGRAAGMATNGVTKWDGTRWSAPGYVDQIGIVAIAAEGASNLYAGIAFNASNSIAQWSGANWNPLGGAIAGWLSTLAVDDSGHVYAGGSFTNISGVAVNNIARWNGSTWSALGQGVDGSVYALAVDHAGRLVVGGNFTHAGGETAQNIALWDGSSWSTLGLGLGDSVTFLAVDDAGHLYAGGDFTNAGEVAANHIARWDGSTWSALGQGITVDGSVYVLAVDSSGNVFVGGNFTNAGGIAANNIAKYTPPDVTPAWDTGYTDLGSNWRRLPWLGDYAILTSDWYFHHVHGYFYAHPESTPANIFFYTADMAWLWTSSTTYPYLYRFTDEVWLYYLPGSSSPRWFNNLSTGTWEAR